MPQPLCGINIKILFMRTILFSIIFVTVSVCLFSQKPYKELQDSSALCESRKEFFFIVEDMPIPKKPLDKIEEFLNESICLTKKQFEIEGETYIQCLVNCDGNSGDFQTVKFSPNMEDINNKIIEVLEQLNLEWIPGKQRSKDVNVLMVFHIKLKKGNVQITLL
jgi:hypothetical protein